jgi:hypothetical protein
MRFLLGLCLAILIAPTAHAQAPYFDAERGHWTVYAGAAACRALNRPPEDFNASPFNALQIVARPGNAIAVEVFFWPGAVDPGRDYDLRLTFAGESPMTLKARPTIGDYALASTDETGLWQNFQDAKALKVAVGGEPALVLHFGLDDIDWVLNALQSCAELLPKS